MQNDILQVDGLAFRYGRREVWSDVPLRLRAGQVAFLTGKNGSGKSTLLRCLAGWDAPSAGIIELCGQPLSGANRVQRRQVTFVPDVPVFYDDLTAGEHISFVQAANRAKADDATVDALLDTFGLTAFRDQYPSSYSRGMRQKLSLMLAFLTTPRLLLLDEPYGPLDPDAAHLLSARLAAVRDAGAAVLVSCHHEVPNLQPDLMLHLEHGRMLVMPKGSQ